MKMDNHPSSKKRCRPTTSARGEVADTTYTTTTTSTGSSGGASVTQPRRLKDLIFQFPDPPETGSESLLNGVSTAESSSSRIDYPTDHGNQSTQFSWPDQIEVSSSSGLEAASGSAGVTESIQSSLDQLGNDITVIKSQLEKKKTKVTLVEINNKLDQVLQYIVNISSSSTGG